MKPLLLTLAIVLTAAPAADAATFKGRTSQDRRVVLETNDRGFPVSIVLRWQARCDDGGRLRTAGGFRAPFRERTRDFVRDSGSYTTRIRDADNPSRVYRVRITGHVRARRVAPRRWRGTFGTRAVVRYEGRIVSRCKTGSITWRASR